MAINNKKLLDELGVEKLTELLKSYTTNSVNTIKHSLDPPYTIGEIPPITKGIYDFTRANRLMFLPADQIIVEQSIDGGATWTSANADDETKRQVFSQFRSYAFAIPLKNGIRSCDCMLRVTITGMKYNVPDGTAETSKYNYWNANYALSGERYCSLSGSFFWVSAITDYIHCKYEAATGTNPNDWQLRGEGFLTGWSGLNYVKTVSATFGGEPSQAANHWNHRYTFRTATLNKDFDDSKLQTSFNTRQQAISEISAIGDNVWSAPNYMMKNNHIYGWDINGNMTLQKGLYVADYIQSNNRMVSPIYYENGVALSNKYAAKTDLEEIQENMADYQEQFVAIGRELEEMYVNVSCDHRYEITGNTGDEHGIAINDQQMIIKKIKGRTLVRNQIYKPLKQGSAWGGGTISFDSDNIITLSGVQTYSYMNTDSFNDLMNLAHKYMIEFEVFANPNAVPIRYSWFNRYNFFSTTTGVGVYRTIFAQPNDYLTQGTGEGINGFSANTDLTGIKYRVRIIDLTLAYGVGNEPTTVEDVLNDFPEYTSYDEGTFVHSNNRLISTGRNVWKLEDNASKISYNAIGSFLQNKITLTSTNNDTTTKYLGVHIKLLPNTTYYTSFNVIGSNYNNITVYRQVSSSGGGISLGTDQFGQRVYGVKQQTLEGGVKHFTTGATEDYYFLFYLLTNTPNNSTTTLENFVLSTVSGVTNEPYKEEVIEIGELAEFDYADNVSGVKEFNTKEIDLGTLPYYYLADLQIFYTSIIGKKSGNTNFRCTRYAVTEKGLSKLNNYEVQGNSNGTTLYFKNTTFGSDVNAFKNSLQGVRLVYETLATVTSTESNLPAGMPVYKSGMQIQEGTIPYLIKKQYALSIKSQVLQNIETDRIQQKQIEALEKFLHQPLDYMPYYVEDPGYAETRLTQDTQINLSQMQGAFDIYLEGHRCIIIEPTDYEIGIFGDANLNGDATIYNYANIPSGCFSFANQGCIGFEGLESAGIRQIMVEFVNNCFIIRSVFVGEI